MADADLMRHGGRIEAARRTYPQAPAPWLDLSTGINPHPYPSPPASPQARARLPDPAETAALEAAAAAAFGVDDTARVAATPGSEAALRVLPHLLRARHAAVVGPAYASHASAWAHLPVRQVNDFSQIDTGIDAAILVRPNNPDGRVLERESALEEVMRRRFVILDEAFVDSEPGLSLAPLAGGDHEGLIVLRSFGKFYGLAGLRLGFVVASPAIAASVRHLFGDWPVSADAIAAGLVAYPDRAWAEAMRAQLRSDAARLDRVLVEAGLDIVGGTSLFRLAAAPDARGWFERLAAAGILARPFADHPTWLRFGLPGADSEFDRLESALGKYR